MTVFMPAGADWLIPLVGESEEDKVIKQLRACNLPMPSHWKDGPMGELAFAEAALGRNWRFDYAWDWLKVAVEIEGIFWRQDQKGKDGKPKKSRHQTGSGYTKDMEKYNAAQALGWKVLRFNPGQITNGAMTATLAWVFGMGEYEAVKKANGRKRERPKVLCEYCHHTVLMKNYEAHIQKHGSIAAQSYQRMKEQTE